MNNLIQLSALKYNAVHGWENKPDRCAINLDNVIAIIEHEKGGCKIISVNGSITEVKENYAEVLEAVEQAEAWKPAWIN